MLKGSKMSEESKEKMRASWCYEKHFTPEMRHKLSESHKGKVRSPEHRQNLSQALKGRTFTNLHRRHLSEGRMGKSNPFYGKRHTDEYKAIISEVLTNRVFSRESIIKMAQAKQGLYDGEKNPFFGKHHSLETRQGLSLSRQKLYIENPGLLKKCLTCQKPNKAEQKLITLITEAGLPYRYVGDGQFILGGKCPDFLNVNGKKQVIEMFGTYWHDIFDVAARSEHFRQYGFATLVIWEDELKHTRRVRDKIRRFAHATAT